MTALLDVRELRTHFRTDDGIVKAVDGVDFAVESGQTVGIVGESGCGKSVTCLSIMGLNDTRNTTSSGEVLFNGENILGASPGKLRRLRGSEIAMIFQDPMTSLNPVHSIGRQLVETVQLHDDISKKAARARAVEALREVGIPRGETRVDDYPHQFSGGMRQRVMIAMGLVNNPDLIIADEPTTALDVTTQAQILALLRRIQDEFGSAMILITHDLGVVADVADEIAVMYAGRIVERSPVLDIYADPAHPYTKGLLASIPRLDMKGQELAAIKGLPPNLTDIPDGCSFNPRCPYVQDVCRTDPPPPLEDVPGGRRSACHFWEEVINAPVQ